MAENDRANVYAYLDQLSTEELNELLRADIESPERGDEKAIFHILEVIEQREIEHPTGRLPDVDKAWEDFQTIYNTPEGEGRSLYPAGTVDTPETQPPASPESPKKRRRLSRVVKTAVLAAIVAALFLPTAMGHGSLFQMLGEWSRNAFHFSANEASPAPTDGLSPTPGEYESLQEALEDYGVTERVVPTWFPEGFVLDGITVRNVPDFEKTEFSAFYVSDDDSISLMYTLYSSPQSRSYEKDDGSVEEYSIGGTVHYLFENNGRILAAWYTENLECSIAGDITAADITHIIDSIYEG